MLNRATLIAAILGPLFVGALIVTAIMADRQTRTVTTVRYVSETQYVTVAKPRVVYVERIVPQVVEVPVEVLVAVPPREELIVQAIPVPPLTVLPEPAIVPAEPPLIEPPVVVAAVCEHRGKGVGKQVGVCRKQGFP